MKTLTTSRIAALISCTVLLVAAGTKVIKGYTTEGHTWATNQVVYYVNPSNLYVSDSAAIWSFQTAAAGWHDQTNANIQLVYGGTTSDASLTLNYKNEVFFRNDSSSYIAETYWWYDGTGHMVDFDTVLHENYTYFSGSGCSNGIYIEDVAIHEFGHGLGLAHSDVAGATMYPSMPGYCDYSQMSLEPDDISGIQSLYPASTSQAPAAPSSLAVKTNSSSPSSSLMLSWLDSASNASGYRVDRSTDGATFATVAQLGGNATSYSDSGLAAGAAYYYRVSAYNNYGSSSYSNVASGQTQAVTNTAPTVTISTPANNSSYANGATVSFSGSATDTQDGNLTSKLVWVSSIDGQIGTGGSFSKALSSGTHIITASVTDSGGLVGSKQITVAISAPTSPTATTTATLTATGSRVKGSPTATLKWAGLSATSVDIYRNGAIIVTTANDGTQSDAIGKKGTYTYTVCATGTATCTNSATVTF